MFLVRAIVFLVLSCAAAAAQTSPGFIPEKPLCAEYPSAACPSPANPLSLNQAFEAKQDFPITPGAVPGVGGVTVTGTPSVGQALVATGASSATWSAVSTSAITGSATVGDIVCVGPAATQAQDCANITGMAAIPTGIAITPQSGTINAGITISQSAPSGGVGSPVNFNYINIGTVTPENVLAGGNFVDGLLIVHQYGAGTGGRQTLEVESRFMSPSAGGNTNRNYVAATFGMLANVADGGSGGQFFASNFVANLNVNATGAKELTGSEVNISARSGSSVDYKAGWSIVPLGTDAVQGTTWDAGLSFSAISGAVGWKDVILFSAANGQHPGNSSSTLIGSVGSSTVANFIDFSSYTCNTTELKFSNLTVSCGGVPTFTAQGTNIGLGFVANGSGAINLANGATASLVIQPNGTIPLIRGSASATTLQISGSSTPGVPVAITSGLQLGSGTPLTLTGGMAGFITQAASISAPGALGGAIEMVCGTGGGTLKIIAFGGTSTAPSTVLDNIGAGATGC